MSDSLVRCQCARIGDKIKGDCSDTIASEKTFANLGCKRLAAPWTDSYPVAEFWVIWSDKLGLPEYPTVYITLEAKTMGTNKMYIAILWRTLAALLLCGFAVTFVSVALFQVGIEMPPKELDSSVTYIKLKPSIAYLSFVFVVLISEFAFPANIIRALGGKRLGLSDIVWRKYAVELAALLTLLSGANGFVAWAGSTETWINYKTFGALSILLTGIYFLTYRAARLSPRGL